MKKLLFIFLIGQLILLSYIFSKSVYDIYELNNLGDTSLDGYIVEGFSGNEMNELYNKFNAQCLSNEACRLQLIKTPVSENNNFIYEIYHSQIEKLSKPESISADTSFSYHQLTKEEFVDSNGVFYTDLPFETLNGFAVAMENSIERYSNNIAYDQIIKNNTLNFVVLLVLTQLVLFIYTFTRIKVNAIKKMLGYSNLDMIKASLKDFFKMEVFVISVTVVLHLAYYLTLGNFISRYFLLLIVFLISVVLLNTILLLVTQFSLRFIDINLMVKNKVYSNRSNMALYVVKILLILAITLSVSSFIKTYREYQEISSDLEQYSQLEGYFTSNGYNYDEDSMARGNPDLLTTYGESIEEMYNFFDKKEQLYVNDAYVLELLSPTYLEINGLTEEDIYNSLQENYIVANERYIQEFMNMKNATGEELKNLQSEEPTILVPIKYKDQEPTVKEFYIEQYNNLLGYNGFFGLQETEKEEISNIEVVYIEDDQEYELLGQTVPGKSGITTLKNSIILVDGGNFDNLYYYDLLNRGDIYFKLKERSEFNQALVQYELSSLVNAGTLLTPYMDRLHFTEFILNNLLVFTVLFLFTLLFVMYISNYVDVVSNSKRYAIQYMHGFNTYKMFKSQLIVWLILLTAIFLKLFIEFNVLVYLSMLVLDLLILLYLYKKVVKTNIHEVIKGA
ncbi:hypothetical protein [Jeotgalibacillus campisalis]|uniref:Bacteriocin-associated integral membrane protein n=1 Tax=Jeotgalibacillus campisalis TaxID=220754 RepID=A0A0C2VHM3_9BACL|nr:hypothetical protein [Jeotgalibacillus campisalis]KIL48372.1 hypothetical protein KR50_14080 [Jeotgalibacillus campisalis]